MRRFGILIAVTTLALLLPAPARAGGSWIEFDGPGIVGTTVTGSGTFGSGQQAPVGAGPWFAELQPSDGSAFDPIPLGEVGITKAAEFGWRATLTFTVPDVPVGEYWVVVHNAEGHGVGDLSGGSLVIATSGAEAALWRRASRAEGRVEGLGRRLDRSTDREQAAQASLAEAQATIDRQADRLASANDRIADLTEQGSSAATPGSGVPWWPILAGLALAAAGFVVGRRYATRTLVTGASRSWAENQDTPASADPKTSPLVAPK